MKIHSYIFLAVEGHWYAPGRMLPKKSDYYFATDPDGVAITLPLELGLHDDSHVAIGLDPSTLPDGLSFATDRATTYASRDDLVSGRNNAFRVSRMRKGGLPRQPDSPKPVDLLRNPRPYPIQLLEHVPLPALPTDHPIIAQSEKL